MPQVPFSVFADFVCTPSQDRYSIVEKFKLRGEYKVEEDLYLLAKQEIYKKALSGKTISLSSVLSKTHHKTKHDIYPIPLNNFESWRNKQKRIFHRPPRALWKAPYLNVSVRPRLAYESKGDKYVVILHYKKKVVVKKKAADFLLHLVAEAYDANNIVGYRYSLIELAIPREWKLGNRMPSVSAQLLVDAQAFASIFNKIDEAA